MFHPTELLRGPVALLLAVFVANLVALVVAQWLLVARFGAGGGSGTRTEGAAGTARPTRAADADGADDRVRCPNCRTANEAGYRFCRECLGELLGRAGVGGSDPGRRPMP